MTLPGARFYELAHLRAMYCLSFIPLVELHANESVRASIAGHALKKQVRCLMVCCEG